jgi:hypothetical protein
MTLNEILIGRTTYFPSSSLPTESYYKIMGKSADSDSSSDDYMTYHYPSANITDDSIIPKYLYIAVSSNAMPSSGHFKGGIFYSSNKNLITQTNDISVPSGSHNYYISGKFGPSSISYTDKNIIVSIWGLGSGNTNGTSQEYLQIHGTGSAYNYWWDTYDWETKNGDYSEVSSSDLEGLTSYSDNTTPLYFVDARYATDISSPSGTVSEGDSSITTSISLDSGEGDVYIYYDTSDKGTSIENWSNSSNLGNQSSPYYTEHQLTSLSNNTYYTWRGYVNDDGNESWTDNYIGFPSKKSVNCNIDYSSNTRRIAVRCSRWEEQNWSMVAEFIFTSGQRDTLYKHITPGALTERMNILGIPTYVDLTYNSSNTLRIVPRNNTGLEDLRNERTIVVKNVSDNWYGREKYIVKIEGMFL